MALEVHRRREVGPQPQPLGGLPLALAHVEMVGACRAAPIDRAGPRPASRGYRYQNVSPGPARRRPWIPCATVWAMRSASSSKSGRRSATLCASRSSVEDPPIAGLVRDIPGAPRRALAIPVLRRVGETPDQGSSSSPSARAPSNSAMQSCEDKFSEIDPATPSIGEARGVRRSALWRGRPASLPMAGAWAGAPGDGAISIGAGARCRGRAEAHEASRIASTT